MPDDVATAAVVNPLDPGNDGHSVENAAADFTRMLEEEGRHDRRASRSEPARNSRSRRSEPEEGDEPAPAAPDPDRDGDGHAPDPDADLGDPILDDAPLPEDDKSKDDEGDDENGDEDNPEDDDDDDGQLNLDHEVEITVNGEVQKVTLKEALDGYSREADYRQKTAILADERREVEEYAQQAVAERQLYATTLQGWLDLTASLAPSQEDWDRLKAADPKTFIATKEQWEAIEKKVGEAKTQRDQIAAREAADQQRAHSQWVKDQNAALAKAVPALANPKKAEAFRKAIFTYGKAAGYSEEELMTGAVDYRDVLTLYKASRFDEIMRSRKAGQRPGKKEPQPSVSTRPRNVSRSVKPGVQRNLRDADRRLARSGSVDDAALAFTALINSESR